MSSETTGEAMKPSTPPSPTKWNMQTQEGLSSLLKDEQAAGGVVRRDSLMFGGGSDKKSRQDMSAEWAPRTIDLSMDNSRAHNTSTDSDVQNKSTHSDSGFATANLKHPYKRELTLDFINTSELSSVSEPDVPATPAKERQERIREENAQLALKIIELEFNLEQCKTDLTKKTDELNHLCQSYAEMENSTAAKLDAEVKRADEHQKKAAEAKKELNSLHKRMEGAIDAKDSDIKSLKAAKAITTQKLNEVQKELQTLTMANEELLAEKERLQNALQRRLENKSDAKSSSEEADAAIQQLNARLEQAKNDNSKLMANLDALSSHMKSLEQEVTELKSANERLASSNEKFKDTNESLRSKLDVAKRQQQEEIVKLKKQCEDLESENSSLRQKLEDSDQRAIPTSPATPWSGGPLASSDNPMGTPIADDGFKGGDLSFDAQHHNVLDVTNDEESRIGDTDYIALKQKVADLEKENQALKEARDKALEHASDMQTNYTELLTQTTKQDEEKDELNTSLYQAKETLKEQRQEAKEKEKALNDAIALLQLRLRQQMFEEGGQFDEGARSMDERSMVEENQQVSMNEQSHMDAPPSPMKTLVMSTTTSAAIVPSQPKLNLAVPLFVVLFFILSVLVAGSIRLVVEDKVLLFNIMRSFGISLPVDPI